LSDLYGQAAIQVRLGGLLKEVYFLHLLLTFINAIFPASKADNNKETKTWIDSFLFV